MKVKYVGPYAAAEVPSLGLRVERGGEVDVDDVTGARLLEQPHNWKAAPKPRSSKPQPEEA